MRWPWHSRRHRPRSVGLALSGGAVRGVAHIGVLEVLEETGIRPDVVAGTSAGALVGALYCAGLPLSRIREEARELRWNRIGHVTRPRLGWFDISRLEERLDELLEHRTFTDLLIPFTAVAADILTGEVVTLDSGPVAAAVRASCSLPGIVTPYEQGERLLVDGGLLNNLPVSVARNMGADYVIAVDLSPSRHRFRKPRRLVEMAMLTYSNFALLANRERDDADCLITPNISHLGLTDFSHTTELMQKGREAAEAALPQLSVDLSLRIHV
jgi:NTE family protein